MNAIDPKLSRLALNTMPGTDRLLQALVDESKGMPTWRPLRALMDAEIQDQAGRVWMTREQFSTWMQEQHWLRRRRKDPIAVLDAVGIGPTRRRSLIHGRDTASKMEALAFAHYANRMEAPAITSAETMAIFVDCYFGGVTRIGRWLEMDPATITNQIQGFRLNNRRERVEVVPDITLLRAMDWIIKVGPFCPYGEPRPAQNFRKEA